MSDAALGRRQADPCGRHANDQAARELLESDAPLPRRGPRNLDRPAHPDRLPRLPGAVPGERGGHLEADLRIAQEGWTAEGLIGYNARTRGVERRRRPPC